MRRSYLRVGPLLVATIVATSGCASKKPASPPPAPEVGVVRLAAQPVTMTTELTGRTAATLASDVRPQVGGIIQRRLFVEGSIVRAGQPLYKIDDRPYRAVVDQAAAALESAQANDFAAQAQAARYRLLINADAVSRQQIDTTIAAARQARAAVHQADATLRAARVNLNYTVVRAPISGRIGRSAVTSGALVAIGQVTALASIQQLDPIFVDVTQSSDALIALRESLKTGAVLPSSTSVRLARQNGSPYATAGRLEFAEVTVDPNTGMVALRARFPNTQDLLLPGMFVRLTAPQGTVAGGILAPQQGVARDAKGSATALVIGPGSKVVQRNIVTAQAIGDKWLVTAGLHAGDLLIVEGTGGVSPGQIVKPRPVSVEKVG